MGGKNNHRKRNSKSQISQNVNGMFLSIGRLTAVLEGSFQISIWLTKKTAFTIHYSLICFVRQKCGGKGNGFDRRLKTLECGWHPPNVGALALLQRELGGRAAEGSQKHFPVFWRLLKTVNMNIFPVHGEKTQTSP